MQVEQRRRGARALEETPGLQIVPAFAVPHRGVGDPLEEMDAVDDHARDDSAAEPSHVPSARASSS